MTSLITIMCVLSEVLQASGNMYHMGWGDVCGAGDLFQPFLFLLFNVGDASGRLLAGFHGKPCPPAALLAYGFLRVLLVVGIAFCNIVTSKPWLLPALLW